LRNNWVAVPRNGSRQDIAGYYSAIDCLDQQIGRVLAKVPPNTIVVFLSDHGDMLGSQGVLLKRKPWEKSVRIPGIISWPGRIAPGVSHVPFSHVDETSGFDRLIAAHMRRTGDTWVERFDVLRRPAAKT